MLKFQETEMSKRAKNILENLVDEDRIHLDSTLGKEIKYHLKYNSGLVEKFSNKKGLDIEKIYIETIVSFDDEKILLLRRCVEFNFTEEQAHEVIKERYRYCYKNSKNQEGLGGAKDMARKYYPEFCKALEITPDKNFPDW